MHPTSKTKISTLERPEMQTSVQMIEMRISICLEFSWLIILICLLSTRLDLCRYLHRWPTRIYVFVLPVGHILFIFTNYNPLSFEILGVVSFESCFDNVIGPIGEILTCNLRFFNLGIAGGILLGWCNISSFSNYCCQSKF